MQESRFSVPDTCFSLDTFFSLALVWGQDTESVNPIALHLSTAFSRSLTTIPAWSIVAYGLAGAAARALPTADDEARRPTTIRAVKTLTIPITFRARMTNPLPLQITETLDSRPCPGSPGLLELLEHLGADPA